MRATKKYQHNDEFDQLLNRKLDQLEAAYRAAETKQEKEQVLNNYGFDIKEFYHMSIRKTDERMVILGVSAHLQRSADYLGVGRQTIYDNL